MTPPRISVLMPTYNRADDLRETLEHFARLDRTGLDVELVVIDNNCSDHTAEVVAEFEGRYPIRRLFQPQPGKNAALNLALDQPELGGLVVFTDDDVRPNADWYQEIVRVSDEYSDYDVFGGRTYVIWPQEPPPRWATSPDIIGWGFASNSDIGDFEGPYPERRYPVGFNYWVRREVLDRGPRFDERLGPVPKNRILGDETLFQKELKEAGHGILYTSRAVVGHKVQPELVTVEGIFQRSWSIGRTGPRVNGIRQPDLFARSRWLWRLCRCAGLVRFGALYALSKLWPSTDQRVLWRVAAIRGLASNLEQLKVVREEG